MGVTGIRQCPFCELRFPSHNELDDHIRGDHPDRVVPDHYPAASAAAAGIARGHTWS